MVGIWMNWIQIWIKILFSYYKQLIKLKMEYEGLVEGF